MKSSDSLHSTGVMVQNDTITQSHCELVRIGNSFSFLKEDRRRLIFPKTYDSSVFLHHIAAFYQYVLRQRHFSYPGFGTVWKQFSIPIYSYR